MDADIARRRPETPRKDRCIGSTFFHERSTLGGHQAAPGNSAQSSFAIDESQGCLGECLRIILRHQAVLFGFAVAKVTFAVGGDNGSSKRHRLKRRDEETLL